MDLAAIIKNPKRPTARDPIINCLVEKGIKIENHLKLYEYTSFWDPYKTPDFLKYKDKPIPFLLLRKANVTTYYRFGECMFLFDKIKDYYDELAPKIYTPGLERAHNFLHDVEGNAFLGAFFRSLGSTLDTLAIEIIIIVGIETINIRDVTFPTLRHKFDKYNSNDYDSSASPKIDTFRRNLFDFLKGRGMDEDWFDQFLEFRRAFTHRGISSNLHIITTTRVEPPRLKFLTHLMKDLLVVYEDIGDEPITEEEGQSVRDRYLEESLIDYCSGLLDKFKSLVNLIYEFLFEWYKLRESKSLKYKTDYEKMIPSSLNLKFRRFINK